MTPVELSTSTPQPLRMRVGKPGGGARLKPLWLPWLGNHFRRGNGQVLIRRLRLERW